MIGSEHEMIKAFVDEMRRYFVSGNEIPVTQVTIKADELRQLLDHADNMLAELEGYWYED